VSVAARVTTPVNYSCHLAGAGLPEGCDSPLACRLVATATARQIGPDEYQRRSVVLGRRLCPTKRDRIPTSMDVLPVKLTEAEKVTRSPTWMASRKSTRSTERVTT
jgi:hypothetical protein